jgi:hypothetical protein
MWFNHPKYKSAKSSLIKESNSHTLKKLIQNTPKILFICGGDPQYCFNRVKVENYLDKHQEKFLFFRAEYAWEVISKESQKTNGSINAMALEEWLADFSDAVIILVESFGTVAELGAFSISPHLRKKLLPILNKDFEKDVSFINTGPVMWVDKESIYAPSIYTDFNTILTCMPNVIKKLNAKTVYKTQENRIGIYEYTRKEFLFYIIYLVTSIGAVPELEVVDIVSKTIKYGESKKDKEVISFMLSLSVALGVIQTYEHGLCTLYVCSDYDKLYRNDSTKKTLLMSQASRASCLSYLMQIPNYKDVMSKVNNDAT